MVDLKVRHLIKHLLVLVSLPKEMLRAMLSEQLWNEDEWLLIDLSGT